MASCRAHLLRNRFDERDHVVPDHLLQRVAHEQFYLQPSFILVDGLPERFHRRTTVSINHAPPFCTPISPPTPGSSRRAIVPWPRRASAVARSWRSDVIIDAPLSRGRSLEPWPGGGAPLGEC